jgi:ribosomal protein S24E
MDKLLVRFKKIKNNRLLNRVQMVVECYHSASQNVTKEQLRDAIKNKFKKTHIVLLQVKKLFGGGRTRGLALVYDNEESLNKIETHRRVDREAREKLAPKDRKNKKGGKSDTRKVKKMKKHKLQKARGTSKAIEKRLATKQARKGN